MVFEDISIVIIVLLPIVFVALILKHLHVRGEVHLLFLSSGSGLILRVLDPIEVGGDTIHHKVVEVHVCGDRSLVEVRVREQLLLVALMDLPPESLLQLQHIFDLRHIVYQFVRCRVFS